MIDQLLESVRASLTGNQFFAGGFVLMAISAVALWLRKTPLLVWMLAHRQLSVGVEIRNLQVARWIDLWLKDQPYGSECRRLKLEVEWGGEDGKPHEVVLAPGPGLHLILWQGRRYLLKREYEEAKHGRGSDAGFTALLKQEVITIRTLGRDQKHLRALIEDARDRFADRRRAGKEQPVHVNFMGDWASFSAGLPRPIESVILDDGIAEDPTPARAEAERLAGGGHRCESISPGDLPPCPGCGRPPTVGCYKMFSCRMLVGCENCGPMFNEAGGEGGCHYSKDAVADWQDHTELCTSTSLKPKHLRVCAVRSPSGKLCTLPPGHDGGGSPRYHAARYLNGRTGLPAMEFWGD